jgi:hypothetical protein
MSPPSYRCSTLRYVGTNVRRLFGKYKLLKEINEIYLFKSFEPLKKEEIEGFLRISA